MQNKIKITSLVLLICWILAFSQGSKAADTTPKTINYQGRLLDSARKPIEVAQTIRFSIWQNWDFVSSDYSGTWSINLSAPNYSGWMEEQSFTPDSYGIFSVQIGANAPLPDIDFNIHKFLQVEVKPSTSPDSAYEILDPTGNLDDTNDRKALNSAFYALNADKVDNTEVGTETGELVKLGSNRQWWINFIPGGTNEDKFILDNNDTASGTVVLQFGRTLDKRLTFDSNNSWFNFNADLLIEGILNLTGNRIDLNSSSNSDIDVFIVANQQSSAGGIIKFNAWLGRWQLTNSGSIFSDILTAEDNQTIVNKNIDGNNNNITNIGWDSMQTRSKSLELVPEYPGVTMYGDGTNNSGTMFADYEDNGGGNKHNFYAWTSRKPVLQDYDLAIRVKLPEDFVSFDSNPINLNHKTQIANLANNKIDFSLENWSGSQVALSGNTNIVSSSDNTWENSIINFSGSTVFSANEWITMRIKLSTDQTGEAYVGEMSLNYLGR